MNNFTRISCATLLGCCLSLGVCFADTNMATVTSDKHLLFGYSQVMIEQNIVPAVYRGTFWRLDNSIAAALPRNFRRASDELNLAAPKSKKKSFIPSLQGLAATKMSGSAEFDAYQIAGLKAAIRKHHQGKICIVDLRQESHFLVNGRSVSWYGLRNWANIGKNSRAIQKEEQKLAAGIQGKVIDVYTLDKNKQPCKQEIIQASDIQSEETMVSNHGLAYYRVPSTDRVCPTAEQIDAFIAFVKNLDGDTWVHFHCAAGKGRTTFFMAVYDMLQNPTVPLKDIAYRQVLLGGSNVLRTAGKNWEDVYLAEKALNVQLIYQYIQDNYKTNYAKTFSEWSRAK